MGAVGEWYIGPALKELFKQHTLIKGVHTHTHTHTHKHDKKIVDASKWMRNVWRASAFKMDKWFNSVRSYQRKRLKIGQSYGVF